jgi:hypothetical protein
MKIGLGKRQKVPSELQNLQLVHAAASVNNLPVSCLTHSIATHHLSARASSVLGVLKNHLHCGVTSWRNKWRALVPEFCSHTHFIFLLWNFIEIVQVAEPELQQPMHELGRQVANGGVLKIHDD